jgi:hypothetical protein
VTGAPDAELVDRVVSAGRRERFRRAALLLAVGLSLATTVGAPVVLVSTHGPRGAYALSDARPNRPGSDMAGSNPRDVRREIYAAALLFVDRRMRRPTVTFGRLRVSGARARLDVRSCDPRCGHAETFVLVRDAHGWRVTRTTGVGSVSW